MKLYYRNSRVEKIINQALNSAIGKQLQKRLNQLEASPVLSAMYAIAGARLEKLTGTRKDEYSVRINDQYRLTFLPANGTEPNNITEIEITNCEDYHS